jgi:hypothetical protein
MMITGLTQLLIGFFELALDRTASLAMLVRKR